MATSTYDLDMVKPLRKKTPLVTLTVEDAPTPIEVLTDAQVITLLRDSIARLSDSLLFEKQTNAGLWDWVTGQDSAINGQAEIISVVVHFLNTKLAEEHAPGSRGRSAQIVLGELVELIASTDVYQQGNESEF